MYREFQKMLQRQAAVMAAGWLIHPCRKRFAIALATALVLMFQQRCIHQLKAVLRLLTSLRCSRAISRYRP